MTHASQLIRRLRRRLAFTITELLVVIAIIVLLIAIAVPAFSSLLSSSEKSLAVNQLKAGLAAARDAAIQSEGGDAAAVFMFTPGGRVSIVPCVVVGQLEDNKDFGSSTTPTAPTVMRDILVPLGSSEPVQMPRGWSIRAFAPLNTICADVTSGTASALQNEPWYASYFATATPTPGAPSGWIFPENAFADTSRAAATNNAGLCRQTFMVRFKAGTGELDFSNQNTALVFDPVAVNVDGTVFRSASPFSDVRADQLRITSGSTSIAPTPAAFVRRVLSNSTIPVARIRRLLGAHSPDTVLTRPVTELALYEEAHLAAGLKLRGLNRATGTVYGDPANPALVPKFPSIDTNLLPAGFPTAPTPQAAFVAEINNWIEGGRINGDPNITYDARIFSVQRYLGQTEEVLP